MLAVVSAESSMGEQPFNKKLKYTWEPIAFDDNDLEGTIQPHDDALEGTIHNKESVDRSGEWCRGDVSRAVQRAWPEE